MARSPDGTRAERDDASMAAPDLAQDDKARAARLRRQRTLGAELRRTFEEVGNEDVPDALRALAEELDQRLGATRASPDGVKKGDPFA